MLCEDELASSNTSVSHLEQRITEANLRESDLTSACLLSTRVRLTRFRKFQMLDWSSDSSNKAQNVIPTSKVRIFRHLCVGLI